MFSAKDVKNNARELIIILVLLLGLAIIGYLFSL